MKITFLGLLGLLFCGSISAQITIEEFDRKVRVEIGEEGEVEAPEATSTCGPVKVSHTDMIASGGCAGTLIRTYVYEDECGNNSSAQVFFMRIDKSGPTFDNLPENVRCKTAEIPFLTEVTAKDKNGLPVTIEFEEKAAGPLIVRMWTAKDSCGNETFGMQTITITDKKDN